jgi:Mrp family chromosome partitioning ATPase
MSGVGSSFRSDAPIQAGNVLQGLNLNGGHNTFNFTNKDGSAPDRDNGARNVHWKVPRRPSTLFTGRTELIARIKDFMQADSQRDRVFVITGLGGSGKSEVCLKIANEMRQE